MEKEISRMGAEREQLLKLVSKWRDEADAMERDWGRVAPMQTNVGRDALRFCADELEEAIGKEVGAQRSEVAPGVPTGREPTT